MTVPGSLITISQVPYIYKIRLEGIYPEPALTVMPINFIPREEGGVCDECGSDHEVYEWITAYGDTTADQDRECARCIIKKANRSTSQKEIYLLKIR